MTPDQFWMLVDRFAIYIVVVIAIFVFGIIGIINFVRRVLQKPLPPLPSVSPAVTMRAPVQRARPKPRAIGRSGKGSHSRTS